MWFLFLSTILFEVLCTSVTICFFNESSSNWSERSILNPWPFISHEKKPESKRSLTSTALLDTAILIIRRKEDQCCCSRIVTCFYVTPQGKSLFLVVVPEPKKGGLTPTYYCVHASVGLVPVHNFLHDSSGLMCFRGSGWLVAFFYKWVWVSPVFFTAIRKKRPSVNSNPEGPILKIWGSGLLDNS